MSSRITVRARFPDLGKALRVIRSYENYARFEATFSDITHLESNDDGVSRRAEELRYESAKTLEALKRKDPVRIPETYVPSEQTKNAVLEAGTLHRSLHP